MSKKSIIQSIAIITSIIALHACNQAHNQTKTEQNKGKAIEIAHADYQCPMDCEKGKVYHEEGKCPVCEMNLQKVEHKPSEKHEHEGAHEHKEGEAYDHKEGDGHNH